MWMKGELEDMGSVPAFSPANCGFEQLELFGLHYPIISEYLGVNKSHWD